ncbi:MAG: hypothetical protein IKL13_01165 [Clostridia bacterium]|nr:hypothetical protein [Clostridia bacterium]
MNKRIVPICILLCVMLSLLCGCGASAREYNEDIVAELEGRDGVLVIREWSYLQGSGAEVYYEYGWRKPILLGQTSGADDGYCPFEAGEYRITQKGAVVELSWRFNDAGKWRSQSFVLPDEGLLKRQMFANAMKIGVLVLALGAGAVWMVRRHRRRKSDES